MNLRPNLQDVAKPIIPFHAVQLLLMLTIFVLLILVGVFAAALIGLV